jgi:hypothetical protein
MRRLIGGLTLLGLLGACRSTERPAIREAELVRCQGRVEAVIPEGFQGYTLDHGCENLDVTSVIIVSPERFRFRRHSLYSTPSPQLAQLRKRGDLIEFDASLDQLESDDDANPSLAHDLEKPNQAPEPTPMSVTPPAAQEPRQP